MIQSKLWSDATTEYTEFTEMDNDSHSLRPLWTQWFKLDSTVDDFIYKQWYPFYRTEKRKEWFCVRLRWNRYLVKRSELNGTRWSKVCCLWVAYLCIWRLYQRPYVLYFTLSECFYHLRETTNSLSYIPQLSSFYHCHIFPKNYRAYIDAYSASWSDNRFSNIIYLINVYSK